MAVTANTKVPTSTSWVQVGQLLDKDILFNQLGEPVQIKTIQHYTPAECYEVEFDDGLTIQGDKHMVFHLQDRLWRNTFSKFKHYPRKQKMRGSKKPLLVKSVEELCDATLRRPDNRLEYAVPNCLPVQYASRDLPVPPYVFGVWFATLSPTGRHWLRGQPFNKMQRIFRNYGYFIKTKKHKNGDTLFDIRPSVRDSFLFAGLSIPTSLPFYYLDGSVAQRIEMLEGLIDGGFIKKSKRADSYTAKNANYHLMRKIQCLVESLGIKTALHTPKNSTSYTLKFRTNSDFLELYGNNRRFVMKITKIPAQPCVHIETGGQFLVGEGFIPVC